jgi:MYXO-CTERM domain-containing protein
MRRLPTLLALALPVALGPASALAGAPFETLPDADDVELDDQGLRVLAKEAVEDNHVSKILYLERCAGGCVLEPGNNDARYNISSIVGGVSVVSEFHHSEEVWQQVVQCVKEIYAPYDVQVTDVNPGDQVFHHKAIVAGAPAEIGYNNPVWGVAPSQCTPRNNVISFTFANVMPASPLTICSVIGQETAHSYGLEHAYDCSDPMTYLSACGRQFFRDRVTPCGEYEPLDQCNCGGAAQNSHRWLRMVLGANPDPVPGPDLTVASPEDGSTVQGNFSIAALATHMRGIGEVELYINGTKYGSREGHSYTMANNPYYFQAPDLPNSILDIEIRATNDIGSESVETITVTRGAPCSAASDCFDGQGCDDGRCIWPEPTGVIGDPCLHDQECISGLCPMAASGEQFCSQECFPSQVNAACPDDFRCIPTGTNTGVCWPEETSGGCGCAASGREGAGTALALALAALLGFRRRRA